MGKCKFLKTWLDQDDSQGLKVKDWGREHNDENVYCFVCEQPIKISSKGFQALTQHASSFKHEQEIRLKLAPNQLHLKVDNKSKDSAHLDESTIVSPLPATSKASASKCVPLRTFRIWSPRDRQTAAELIWSLKCVASDYSFASCNGLSETFKAMWGDDIIGDFSLGNNKVHYLITDTLAPYFKDQQKHDMEGTYFTVMHDETTNAAGKSELLTGVRYWSDRQGKIVCEHLKTFYIGSGTADVLCDKILQALSELSLSQSQLLMIGSDGPNVNKSVFRKINDSLLSTRKKELINIGTCNIHTIHNAFLKGLKELGEDVSELVFSIHRFFDQWPKRWPAYRQIQEDLKLPTHHFIKHCPSRWLSLKPAAERLLQQWTAVRKYFLDYIPKKKPNMLQRPGYIKIVHLLRRETMKAEVMFVVSSANIFNSVTQFLQKKEPLVHKLHSQLELLIRTILGRIYKGEFIRDLKMDEMEDICPEKLLPFADIVIGDQIAKALQNVKEKERKLFFLKAQKHYTASIEHLLKKSSFSSSLLKSLSCLDPLERLSGESVQQVVEVARTMPWEVSTDLLLDEWKLLQREVEEEGSRMKPIDVYWNQFFRLRDMGGMDSKYPVVSKLVKAALSLSHGSADIERGFSASGRALTGDRAAMSERTLNALMTVKSSLANFDNKPHLVPITSKLMDMGRVAYKAYNAYLEDIKRKAQEKLEKERERLEAEKRNLKQLEKKRKIIAEEEEKLKIMRKEEDEALDSASKLLKEANDRLKKAIKNKDFKEAALAQAMIEGAAKVSDDAGQQRQTLKNARSSLEKKKTKLISDFFNKKNQT